MPRKIFCKSSPMPHQNHNKLYSTLNCYLGAYLGHLETLPTITIMYPT